MAAVRRVRSESRRELWFWRVTTGAALSVCAFLPFQGTQARVDEREDDEVVQEQSERPTSRARASHNTSASARVRMLLATLERSTSTSNRCMTIDRIARMPELDDTTVGELARFTEEGNPLELRRCAGWALQYVISPAAIAPLKALAGSENMMLAETGLVGLANRPDRASQKAAVELSAKRVRSLRVSVACALAEAGATEAVPLLAELLGDGNITNDRERLLMSLGRTGDPRAVTVLQGFLQKSTRMTQHSVIYALGEIGGPTATETLLGLLRDRPDLSQIVVGALARTGSDEARETLLGLAEQNIDYGTGLYALQQLGDLDGPGVQALMLRALDSTPNAQGTAIEYFVNHPQDDVFAKLESLARGGSPQSSSMSLQALARIGGDQALDVIESVATSGSTLAPMALQMLNQDSADPQRARRIALEQLKSGNASAIEILVNDDSPESRAAMVELARKGDSSVTARALSSLEQRNDPEARKLTEELASASDPGKRASAMWALSQSGDPGAIKLLRKGLSDSDDNVRREAVQALGQLPGAESEAALLGATRDKSPDIVGAAANALASLGTPTAIKRIEEIASKPETASQGMNALINTAPSRAQAVAESLIASEDIAARRAALMAAPSLPSETSTKILVRALSDSDPEFVREAFDSVSNGFVSDEVRATLRGLSTSQLPDDLKTRAAELASGSPNGMMMHDIRAHRIY